MYFAENCRYEHPRDAGRSGQGYNDNRNQNRFGALSGTSGGNSGGSQGQCDVDFSLSVSGFASFHFNLEIPFMLLTAYLYVLTAVGIWDSHPRRDIYPHLFRRLSRAISATRQGMVQQQLACGCRSGRCSCFSQARSLGALLCSQTQSCSSVMRLRLPLAHLGY
jgi:hypothetical protein